MAAIPNSEVTCITPELLFPHLGAGDFCCCEHLFSAMDGTARAWKSCGADYNNDVANVLW